MNFDDLFDRAAEYDVDNETVSAALAERRSNPETAETAKRNDATQTESNDTTGHVDNPPANGEPTPARVVADADVLAADFLVGGASREALDLLRSHSWTTLVASDLLLDDAESVIAALADSKVAADWRATVEGWRISVTHPPDDHPALASAYHGGAMQIVSLDSSLTGPGTAAGLRDRMPVSVREPRAFATVFSPERLYPEAVGGEYPGPDRDPRSMSRVSVDEDQHR